MSDQLFAPVLLHASSRQKASNFVVPPRQPDEHYHTESIFRKSIQMPIYHLTKSEETPCNIAHYEVSSMRNFATKVFVISSPIYNVHYEICPPSDQVEEYKNPHLQNTVDLVLTMSQKFSCKAMQVSWKSVKLATAYGFHCAIQKAVVTERIRNLKTSKANKQQSKMVKCVDCIPKSNVFTVQIVKAPEKQLLKLCSVNDADNEPRKVTEIIIGEQFYDALP